MTDTADPLAEFIDNTPLLPARCRIRRGGPPRPDGRFVLHWMQRAQRAENNDALTLAAHLADGVGKGVVSLFVLGQQPRWNEERHRRVLLDGLIEVAETLRRSTVHFVVVRGDPVDIVTRASRHALAIVTDTADLAPGRQWREKIERRTNTPFVEVDTDVVIPADVLSTSLEYAARTIRPKVHRLLESYRHLTPPHLPTEGVPPTDIDSLTVDVSGGGEPVDLIALRRSLGSDVDIDHIGGTGPARRDLDEFVHGTGIGYADRPPDPLASHTSRLSTALHYGHISVREVLDAADALPQEDRSAFIEQLVVRRELAINYARRSPDPESYASLPDWARRTLDSHRHDARDAVYDADELLAGATHDRAWNASMTLIRRTGFLHNHLRMYWGKQVIRWSPEPEVAFARLVELNNRWFLDGRDALSFTNVAWCFGLHDRPFARRPVLGTVRPMTRAGLHRKFDVDAWLASIVERFGVPAVEGPAGEASIDPDSPRRRGAQTLW